MSTALDLIVPPTWTRQGPRPACAGTDPAMWFPDKGEPSRAAQAICRRCLLQPRCAEWAIKTEQPHGIWGGLTPPQRRQARACRSGRCIHESASPEIREMLGLRPKTCPWKTPSRRDGGSQ